ncbi:MAG: ATP-binding protein [Chromatiales bacterium]|nr:ATP-binding protein [Chromatiales bacterium]
MRFWPATLLGRTLLVIALLLVLAQAAWFQLIQMQERGSRLAQAADSVASVVALVRASLIEVPTAQRPALIEDIQRREGVRVEHMDPEQWDKELRRQRHFRQRMERDPLLMEQAPHLGDIYRRLRDVLGHEVIFRPAQGQPGGLAVGIAVDDERYWVVVPRSRIERPFPWTWLMWGGLVLALSALGAWLLVSRINRPLRRLSEAARAIGRGEHPPALAEAGPAEIATLNRAFNQMAADIRRLAEDRELLLAGVSHDLRTPLARLRLETEMLPDALARARTGMTEDIEEMDAIIGQFLAYLREWIDEAPQDTEIDRLLAEMQERYRRGGQAFALRPGGVPSLPLRPLAIQRLLGNLLDNAFRHGGGEVEMTTSIEDGQLVVRILDRGPGIPMDQGEGLLRPFTRLDASRGSSGSGLGLAIAERIARLHGGRLYLLPRDGGGLEARLELPLQTA